MRPERLARQGCQAVCWFFDQPENAVSCFSTRVVDKRLDSLWSKQGAALRHRRVKVVCSRFDQPAETI
jgi:hypothetical protein